MSHPERKGQAPVEATQELRSLDVLEIIQTLAPKPPGPRPPVPSSSSIAPVGLDLMPSVPRSVPRAESSSPSSTLQTASVSLEIPRRKLGSVVAVTVAVCALILVAAGVVRVVHASSEPSAAARAAAAIPAAAPSGEMTAAPAPSPTVAPPDAPAAAASGAPTADDRSSGKVRLERPAVPSRTWLDGKKMSSATAVVSCGTHQIRVGFRRKTHSIDVPCGGEIAVSK
jgi:hypothetical protein